MSPLLVQPLFPGPVDVIGDVHGEFEALMSLVAHLGYDDQAGHAEGRRLVFVGDLVDRGPGNLRVIRWVSRAVALRRAQVILGNHELCILLGKDKPSSGNGWFFNRMSPGYPSSAPLTLSERAEVLAFLSGLPLALERPDLRVVHAAWDDAALARARSVSCSELLPWIERGKQTFLDQLHRDGVDVPRLLRRRRGLPPSDGPAPPIDRQMERFDIHKDAHPVWRTLCGGEVALDVDASAYFLAGRWRFTQRDRWWERYPVADPVVIFGHYWRDLRAQPAHLGRPLSGQSGLTWLGPGANAFCVDYSVGKRHHEGALSAGDLGALRLPSAVRPGQRYELLVDSGQRHTVLTEREWHESKTPST